MPFHARVTTAPVRVLRRHAIVGAAALFGEAAAAEGKIHWTTDLTASSAILDRGEQIGGDTIEMGASIETSVQNVTLYTSFYRLLPVGSDQDAFDDEADYTVGAVFQSEALVADISVSRLTYPGEGAEASTELMGIFDFDAPFSPRVIGFYDADFGDWGLEASVQPSRDAGDWTVYAMVRTGFVAPGDGSANRSYAGMEIGALRPLSTKVELGVFARAEVADEESYADKILHGLITRARDQRMAAGISLSVSG